jgi:predicted DNA binding CopG/RHH family protein
MLSKKKVRIIPKMQSVNISFTPMQVKALKARAKKDGVSFSELVRRAVDAYGFQKGS